MTKRFAAAALLLALALPLYADFNAVARAIDGYRGVKRIWMPGVGLARFFVWVVSPKGVHDFQVAAFEGADNIDGRDLQSILASNLEPGFTPLVRVWSHKSSEWSFVYVRPRGENSSRLELMVLAKDDDDTVLVRVDVDAEIIARELDEPRNMHRVARR